jgi:hypothetical protein
MIDTEFDKNPAFLHGPEFEAPDFSAEKSGQVSAPQAITGQAHSERSGEADQRRWERLVRYENGEETKRINASTVSQ